MNGPEEYPIGTTVCGVPCVAPLLENEELWVVSGPIVDYIYENTSYSYSEALVIRTSPLHAAIIYPCCPLNLIIEPYKPQK